MSDSKNDRVSVEDAMIRIQHDADNPRTIDLLRIIQTAFWDAIELRIQDYKKTHVNVLDVTKALGISPCSPDELLELLNNRKAENKKSNPEPLYYKREPDPQLPKRDAENKKSNPEPLYYKREPDPQLPKRDSGCDMCEEFMKKFHAHMKDFNDRMKKLESEK